MNALLTLIYLLLCVGVVIFLPTLVVPFVGDYGIFSAFDAAKAVLLCTALAALISLYAYKRDSDGVFLLRLFVAALIVRMVVGLAIFAFRAQDFLAATP